MGLYVDDLQDVPKTKRQLQLTIFFNRHTEGFVGIRKPRGLLEDQAKVQGKPLVDRFGNQRSQAKLKKIVDRRLHYLCSYRLTSPFAEAKICYIYIMASQMQPAKNSLLQRNAVNPVSSNPPNNEILHPQTAVPVRPLGCLRQRRLMPGVWSQITFILQTRL